MTTIINMTPHPINIVSTEGEIIKVFQPSGNILKVGVKNEPKGEILGIPLEKNIFLDTELPEVKDDTYYLVSAMVLGRYPQRTDFIAPDTNRAVRDDKGFIIGVKGFVQ